MCLYVRGYNKKYTGLKIQIRSQIYGRLLALHLILYLTFTASLYDRKYACLQMGVCLFVFVALRPMSTAMVMAGRSVHLTTLFPGQA